MAAVPDLDFGGKRAEGVPGGERILVVDDERHIVRLVQVNLERAGYKIVTAFDGREALEKVESEHPDLVILDVMMPYVDGFEVLQTLRKNPATQHLPVIMLTAKAQDADIFRGWQSGVDSYLTKPFNPMELLGFVRRILDISRGNDNSPAPAGAPLAPAAPM